MFKLLHFKAVSESHTRASSRRPRYDTYERIMPRIRRIRRHLTHILESQLFSSASKMKKRTRRVTLLYICQIAHIVPAIMSEVDAVAVDKETATWIYR